MAEQARITLTAPRADVEKARRTTTPFGLTPRELTVLRQIGAGRTNVQIATTLFISTSTAGVHVSNILRKLKVTSRVQAAAIASTLGLQDEFTATTPRP